MNDRAAGYIGMAATVLFAACLLIFAEISPGYSHATKAVSELGAIGAPYQFAWNVLGFLLPGILMIFHGWGVGAAASDRVAGFFLALAGLSFAATSIPADMANYSSTNTVGHIAASSGAFGFWLIGALKLAYQRGSERHLLSRVAVLSLWLAVAATIVRFSGLVYPGTGQRVAFAAFFAWIFASAVVLIVDRTPSRST